MRLRTELSDDQIASGFDPSTDIFNHKDLALRLTGLFEQIEHGSVALLDGRWGTGKSTFVRQWAAELKKMGIPSVYFDAFASDYLESPFQAIAGSFISAAIDAKREKEPAYKNFLSKAASVGKTIASVSAKVGVKAATLGMISAAEIGEIGSLGDSLVDGFAEITEESVKTLLENQANSQAQFNQLKRALEDLPSLLRPSNSDSVDVPLIVFIDELDRCKPDFSLGILETLKHFFRVNKIHFILVTNKEYLSLSVDSRYGVGDGASEYLEKFYDFVIFFEQNYDRSHLSSVSAYVNVASAGILPEENRSYDDIRDYIKRFSSAYRLSLRQIQSFTTNVAISYLAARDKEFRPDVLVSFLAIIKILRPELYKKAKAGNLTWQAVETFIDSGIWLDSEGEQISKVLQFHTDPNIDINSSEWRGWGNSLFNYNIERHRVMPYLANSVLDRFGAPSERKLVIEEGED